MSRSPRGPEGTASAGRGHLVPVVGAIVTLLLGLCFTFVWAPHPWGWRGIDQYHELARGLARGEPFATTDVPWGYAYFVAACYRIFGEHAWIPVTLQVIANAAIPLMLYQLVRPLTSPRVAAIASLLVGVLSFNTLYASTQASDSLCTVLFIAALWCFARGHFTGLWSWMALSGLLFGLVPQFRPNMVLLPLIIAGAYVIFSVRRKRAFAQMAVLLALVAVALSPWVVRNYRLTGAFLPTSTHGGVQLWYGTLQVGPYLESRAHNPRSIFEHAAFDYTSLAGQSIIITAASQTCGSDNAVPIELVYHTDREPQPVSLAASETTDGRVRFEVPGQPAPTTVYLHVDPAAPYAYFVADEHLIDLDRHDDWLDVFDLIRSMRHVAWAEPLRSPASTEQSTNQIDETALRKMVVQLLGDGATLATSFGGEGFAVDPGEATLHLADGSSFGVPRRSSGRVTDLEVSGGLAGSLVSSRRLRSVAEGQAKNSQECRRLLELQINQVFYRQEPHLMRRYFALAMDNIERQPGAFALASLYRIGRLFLIRGTADVRTTQQFEGSRLVYFAALTLSMAYLLLFLIGVTIAWRAGSPLLTLLLPIIYVPVTICVVLTNMRYTITVQPLMFVFMALAIGTLLPSASRQPAKLTASAPPTGSA